MRILYIINSFTYGGAEKSTCDLALQLTGRMEYIGILALYEKDNETEKKLREKLSSAGIVTDILGKRVGKDRLRCTREIYRYLKKNQIQIIHLHCAPMPMLLGKAAGRMANVSVLCTIHSTQGYEVERFTSWLTDEYISVGQGTRDYMIQKLHIPESKIRTIFNGMDTERFQKTHREEHFWESYGGAAKEQAILHVGRVCAQKNQLCILRALLQCVRQGYDCLKLYILGAYEEIDPVYLELIQYIRRNGLSEYVVFLGMLDEVERFYANADCLVLTSWNEGFSIALTEAVVSGCPVIATELPFVLEANSIAECVTVIPQDDDKKLAEFLKQGRYKRQKEETIRKFSDIFSIERAAGEHYEQYTDVRNRKSKGIWKRK